MRINRQTMFMDMAEVASRRATCFRGNIGALVVSPDHDVTSMGYNGPASGEPHCKGMICEKTEDGGCLRSLHAEENAIKRALKKVPSLAGFDLYTTSNPCPRCADLIVSNEFRRVYYRHPYRVKEGLDTLQRAGVPVYRVSAAGVIISEKTGLVLPEAHL